MTKTEGVPFPRREIAFLFLAGIFLVSLVIANAMAAKLFVIAGVVLVAGIIPYPITFLATDLICEVYGKRRATILVFVGFILSFFILLVIKLGQYAPPFEGLNRQAAYEVIFGGTTRAIIASMIAYIVAQILDVQLFHLWKRLTKGKHLWLRNNGSTMISQLIDTVLVVSILFYGDLPNKQIIQIIGASYLFKILIAGTDTPFFYLGTRYLQLALAKGLDTLRSAAFARDALLGLAALANISLLVAGALTWQSSTVSDAGGMSPQGALLVLFGVAAHLVTTVALANPHHARPLAIGIVLIGILTTLVAHGMVATAAISCIALTAAITLTIAGLGATMIKT